MPTNQFFTGKNGEAQQKTTWHDCKRYVREVNASLVEKLTKGASIILAGTLNYDEFAKDVSKAKTVNVKRAFIDVKELSLP